jgi:hypothetical protein
MTTNLHPTKIDKLRDKLLNIETFAFQSRHLLSTNEDRLLRNIRLIGSLYNELWIMINTEEEKGKKLGWWE